MKLLLPALVCFSVFAAQDRPPDQRKHLSVPTQTNLMPVRVAAAEIERGTRYPAILHLKGDVEIRTPVCVKTASGTETACGGYVVVHADEAELHEDSGEVEAHGKVRITRE
jgi:lipopolysaccharide assembly outer membrane protein LptD (OstA)